MFGPRFDDRHPQPEPTGSCRRGRRGFAAVLLATATVTTGFAGIPSAHAADPLFDVAVSFTAAQPVVQPGRDAYLTATARNNGQIAWLNATMTINTGGRLDSGYTTEPSFANHTCTLSSATTTEDIVTCTYGFLAAAQSEPPVSMAVVTPLTGSSMSSRAALTATPVTTPVNADPTDDNSKTITTTLTNNSGTGALTDGDSLTFTSADGAETTTFSVPQNGTHGGVVIVQLDEQNTTTNHITCAGAPCYGPAAEAKWTQIGGTPVQNTNPFTTTVTYNLKRSCNGLGATAGCLDIYYLNGSITGDAIRVPLCTTYTPQGGTPIASHDPCVFAIDKSNAGIATYRLAELQDQIIPISL